jgi:hypothetical protein
MIGAIERVGYGPIGSTWRPAGPTPFRFGEGDAGMTGARQARLGGAMHDNPRATEHEQELARRDRRHDEEE